MSQPVSASGVLSWLVREDGGAAGATAAPPAPCPCAKGAQHSASGIRPLSAHKLEPKWVCEHLNIPERLPWHRRGSGWHHCKLSHATAKQPEHRPCLRRWMGTGGISGSHLLPSPPGHAQACCSLMQSVELFLFLKFPPQQLCYLTSPGLSARGSVKRRE